jgi:hypothetical protein
MERPMGVWQGVATDSLMFCLGLPCPSLLRPVSWPPTKWLYSCFRGSPPASPCLRIPDKSENISQIYSGYILGYIPDISKIHLGCRCIPDTSRIYPRCIPDVSQIHPTSRIHLEYILDSSWLTDESGIHLFIPNISGIPRLGGSLRPFSTPLDTPRCIRRVLLNTV